MQGTMLWFNEVKDFGFIRTEEGERLSVPGSGFVDGARPKGRCAGAVVGFEVAEADSGRTAQDVVFVAEVAPRRARRRHSGVRAMR
jgi:cold shock CspA family protein